MAKASVMLIKNSLKSSFQDKKLAGVKLSEASRLENVLTIRGKTIEKIQYIELRKKIFVREGG